MTLVTNDNRYNISEWMIDPTPGQGTHQSFAALNADPAVVSGDVVYVRAGTYTEDIEPISGVTYMSLDRGYLRGNTKIVGKIILDDVSNCLFKGFQIQTNGDYLCSDEGTTAGTVDFEECDFIYSDFAGWLCTNTNRTIVNYCCNNSIQGNSLKIYELAINVYACRFCFWEGGSATPTGSTISAGNFAAQHCNGIMPFTTSGTGFLSFNHTSWGRLDTDMITHNGTGTHSTFTHTQIASGTQPAITVGAGATIVVHDLTIFSSNANAIGGAGTMQGAEINFNSGNGGITIATWATGISRNRAMQFTTGATINEFSTDGTLAGDSDTAVPTEKAVKTYVDSQSGGGGGDKVFYYKATDFDALETNFAPLVQDNGTTAKVMVRAFDQTTEEYVNFSLTVPSEIDTAGTVTFRVWMYASTAVASRFVALTFGHRAIDNSESWDGAYTDEDSGDIAIDATQDDITEATWTETVSNLGWAANDIVLCRLSRYAPSGTNLASDLYVLGFAVEIPRV